MISVQSVHVHPEFESLCPPLTADELDLLERNIEEYGFLSPITVWKNHFVILDGHNRYRIYREKYQGNEARTPEVVELFLEDENEAKLWIIQNQLARRNLNAFQKGELALAKEPVLKAKAKQNQGNRTDILPNSAKNSNTRKEIAETAGVSGDTIHKVKTILEKADPETVEKVRRADISIHKAYSDIRTKERRAERHEEMSPQALPNGQYAVIYADPPWRYEFSKTTTREIENQYPTMTLQEICELNVPSIAADDSVLFLWATPPKLAESLEVVKAWGFNYRTHFVWDKQRIDMGYYARQQHENLLVCTKGNPPVPDENDRAPSIVRYTRAEHSQKPERFYEIIEGMYPKAVKVELFARQLRDGWEVWGNEVTLTSTEEVAA